MQLGYRDGQHFETVSNAINIISHVTRFARYSLALDAVNDMRRADKKNPTRDPGMAEFVLSAVVNPALALSETLDDVLKLKSCLFPGSSPDYGRRIDEMVEMKLNSTVVSISEKILEDVGLMEIIR